MKYSTTAFAAAIAVAQAAPAQPVCKVLTTVVTGSAIWVPQPAPTSWAAWSSSKTPNASTKTETETWSVWDPSTSKAPVAASTETWAVWDPSTSKTPVATSTESWSAWVSPTTKNTPVAASTTTNAGWGTWSASTPVAVTSTTTKVWEHSTTPAAVTTTTSSYSQYVPPTTTTTTSSAPPPPPAATCPAQKTSFDAGSGFGDCNCDYTTYCNMHVGGDLSNVKFWERTSGELIDTLEECIQICDDNDSCTAAIWTDSSSAGSQDYKHCWQTNGLPTPNQDGYGQISYKGQCSGSCSGYINGSS